MPSVKITDCDKNDAGLRLFICVCFDDNFMHKVLNAKKIGRNGPISEKMFC